MFFLFLEICYSQSVCFTSKAVFRANNGSELIMVLLLSIRCFSFIFQSKIRVEFHLFLFFLQVSFLLDDATFKYNSKFQRDMFLLRSRNLRRKIYEDFLKYLFSAPTLSHFLITHFRNVILQLYKLFFPEYLK